MLTQDNGVRGKEKLKEIDGLFEIGLYELLIHSMCTYQEMVFKKLTNVLLWMGQEYLKNLFHYKCTLYLKHV